MSALKKIQAGDEKKELFINRLLETVREYFGAFERPIPIKILSSKYGRAFEKMGGFPEILKELSTERRIQIYLLASGAKVVYPGGAEAKNLPEEGVKL